MAKKYNVTQMRHLKVLFRHGLNATSGSVVAGSKIRIIHSR